MGYRHQMMAAMVNPLAGKEPEWFIDKYDGTIDFDAYCWASVDEFKLYGVWKDLAADLKKALWEVFPDPLEAGEPRVRLVFYADESADDFPDIAYLCVTHEGESWIRMQDLLLNAPEK